MDGDGPTTARTRMVDALLGGAVTTSAVEAAMRAVPREVFLPDVSVEEAYRDQPVVTKRDIDGAPTSSASQPAIVAIMLEQLDLRGGERVLEIGAGTGYNAALLSHLVGPEGEVVTVDLDEDVAEGARRALDEIDATDVHVLCGDGGRGHPESAPYDRIIVTVGAWDLPRAWFDQLRVGGVLVVPLGLRGAQRSVAFERREDHWHGRSAIDCGFMPMRGPYAEPTAPVRVGEAIDVRPSDDDVPDNPGPQGNPGPDGDGSVDPDALLTALRTAGDAVPSGVSGTFREFHGSTDLWLALSEPAYCRLLARAPEDQLLPALSVWDGTTTTAGLVVGDSCALLGTPDGRPMPQDGGRVELHIHAHGQAGGVLADRLLAALRAWDTHHRPTTPTLRVDAYPAPHADHPTIVEADQFVVDRPGARVVITWGES